MIRRVVARIALIIMSIGCAHAQTVQKIEIYEFGTYTSGPEVQIGWSRQGLRQNMVDGIDLIERTRPLLLESESISVFDLGLREGRAELPCT